MIPVLRHKNNKLYIDQTSLIEDKLEETSLTANMAVGTAMTVKSQLGFHATTNQPIILGELGNEITEIVESTTSSSPSTITLANASIFAHSAGTKVYLVKYDQIEISHATTAIGSKSVVVAATNITPSKKIYVVEELTQTTGFYFARFKESVGGTFSGYTDAVPFDGWDSNTVGYMMDRALRDNKITLSENITRFDIYSWINDCLKLIQGKQLRWPQHQNLNAIIGQTERGLFIHSLPSDIYDNDSNKSIIGVRVGDGQSLSYFDPLEWEERIRDMKYTQVRTEASATDTSLALDNSYDFVDTGSVTCYISGTKYVITYTGVTRDDVTGATAVLTGVPASGDGSITVTIPVDTYIYQDVQEGEPVSFTIRGGNLEILDKPDAGYDNNNIYMDYWKVATEVNSDGDTIDKQRFDIVQDYLTWRVKMKDKNSGELEMRDGYYTQYREKLNDAIRNKPRNLKYKMKPKINKISYGKFGGRVRPDVNS